MIENIKERNYGPKNGNLESLCKDVFVEYMNVIGLKTE